MLRGVVLVPALERWVPGEGAVHLSGTGEVDADGISVTLHASEAIDGIGELRVGTSLALDSKKSGEAAPKCL